MAKTLYDKVYDSHVVFCNENEVPTLYIDRHLMHEVTSPQAFSGLEIAHRQVWKPENCMATMDHDISTKSLDIKDCSDLAREQINALINNTKKHNIRLFPVGDDNQGIVHIVGPQTGFTLPGCTLVCGDSHTATHGAFGALAFGIGTSEVEHVLATSTIKKAKLKTMKIEINGTLNKGVYSKDIILYIIGKLTAAGGTGYAVEFCGSTIKSLSMDARMTICNMAIEFGATVGMIAPDETTFNYIKGRMFAPKDNFDKCVEYWKTLKSDADATFDKTYVFEASDIKPQITWGTNLSQEMAIDETIPALSSYQDEKVAHDARMALDYIGLKDNEKILGAKVDVVFIGSCTNGRLEDFKIASEILKGKKIAPHVEGLAVPGSMWVKQECERLGIDKIFKDAGFSWRNPGCSMCLGMNDDIAKEGQRVASTSNRNFVGRQGKGVRTHLVSPATAAICAIEGKISDIREFIK